MEDEYRVHEYSYWNGDLKHRSFSASSCNEAKHLISGATQGAISEAFVFLILNGIENEEEAWVFEDGRAMYVDSYDAIRAVELISCLPFHHYTDGLLMRQLASSIHDRFMKNKWVETETPF